MQVEDYKTVKKGVFLGLEKFLSQNNGHFSEPRFSKGGKNGRFWELEKIFGQNNEHFSELQFFIDTFFYRFVRCKHKNEPRT